MLLTEQEVDALRKSLPAVCKHQDVIRAAESAVLEKLKAQEPVAYMVQHDGKCMGFLPTSEKNTVPVFTYPLPPDDVVRDAERLDWLEQNLTGASDSERYLPFRVYWGDGRGIRKAIDAAMKEMK